MTTDAVRLVGAELEMLLVTPLPMGDILEGEIQAIDATEHFQQKASEGYERRENDWGEERSSPSPVSRMPARASWFDSAYAIRWC